VDDEAPVRLEDLPYFPARIEAVHGPQQHHHHQDDDGDGTTVDILYEDGDRETRVPLRFIRARHRRFLPQEGWQPMPLPGPVRPGMRVLVSIRE
jgi:hypothetical protein